MFSSTQEMILGEILRRGKISVPDLEKLSSLSQRTLRKKINAMNDALLEYGLQIVMKKIEGYFIVGSEKNKNYLLTQLEERKKYTMGMTISRRSVKILHLLLQQEDYITTEEIADFLWLSRSAFKKDLKEARATVKRYGIKWETKPHYGIKLQGNEIQIRQCMVDFCIPYSHLLENVPFLGDGYNDYQISPEDVYTTYKILAEVFYKHQLGMSEQALEKFVITIYIAQKRFLAGHKVILPKSLQQLASETTYASPLTEVFSKIKLNLSTEEESFLILLAISKCDYYKSVLFSSTVIPISKRANTLFKDSKKFFTEELNVDFSRDPEFETIFPVLLEQIFIQKELGWSDWEYMGPSYQIATQVPSSRQIAVLFCSFLEKKIGYFADLYSIITLTIYFYNTIMVIPTPRKNAKLLCVFPYDMFASRAIEYKFSPNFKKYVKKIDFCSPQELPFLDQNMYDNVFYMEDSLPVFENEFSLASVKYFYTSKELDQVMEKIIWPKDPKAKIYVEEEPIKNQFIQTSSSIEEFYLRVTQSQKSNYWVEEPKYTDLFPPILSNSSSLVLCIFSSINPKIQNCIYHYDFEKPIFFKNHKIFHGIVCTLYLEKDTSILKNADSLLRRKIDLDINLSNDTKNFIEQ